LVLFFSFDGDAFAWRRNAGAIASRTGGSAMPGPPGAAGSGGAAPVPDKATSAPADAESSVNLSAALLPPVACGVKRTTT
jgi:hypothetical protein